METIQQTFGEMLWFVPFGLLWIFPVMCFFLLTELSDRSHYGKCPKGKWPFRTHDLKDESWKSNYIKDSGFRFYYTYCVNKKCTQCGKLFKHEDYET
jgi:hypothetical protein